VTFGVAGHAILRGAHPSARQRGASFTITLSLLLEQTGFAPGGQAPRPIADG
jgi:hypothetical protein